MQEGQLAKWKSNKELQTVWVCKLKSFYTIIRARVDLTVDILLYSSK